VRPAADRDLHVLLDRISSLEQDLREMEQLVIGAERQAAHLASLYVATYQLHASLDPDEVRGAIGEIAVNLLGAASCVLLIEHDDAPGYELINLVPGTALPITLEARRYVGGDALIDAGLRDGALRFGPHDRSPAVAVVPLSVQGRTVGALVILALLPQKAAFRPEDRELLDLLAAHAASALVGARVFQETRRKLRTLEGVIALMRRS
jgi:GAF domain-containing protein